MRKIFCTKNIYWVIFLAFIIRLLSVIFSKGFATHDDHFLPIETTYKWLSNQADFFSDKEGAWRNQLYNLLHYLILKSSQVLGITDPQSQMFIVRLWHSLYSLLTVFFGYKLSFKLSSNKRDAIFIAYLLSFFWIFPYLSVRSLVEVVCIPPLLAAAYYSFMALEEDSQKIKFWALASFCFALAFTFRFQSFPFGLGFGIVLLFQKKFKDALLLLVFTLFFLFIIMGILDWVVYGYPFAAIIQYSIYNLQVQASHIDGAWYLYLIVLVLILNFPTGLLFIWGIIKSNKKKLPLLAGMIAFILLHSLFSNKQERFIIPAIPFLLILGYLGWTKFTQESKLWRCGSIQSKALWICFWTINGLLLSFTSTIYSKKNRIEMLYYLYPKTDVQAVVIENSGYEIPTLPLFYLQKQIPIYKIENDNLLADYLIIEQNTKFPNYFIFMGNHSLDNRIKKMENFLNVKLEKQVEIEPDFIEKIQFKLNPKYNLNQITSIYKLKN